MQPTNVGSNNLSAYAPADHLAKRARLLQDLRDAYCDLTYEEKQGVKQWMQILMAEQLGDPICALCSNPQSKHSHYGEWCPNELYADGLFSNWKKFTRAL